MNVELELIIIPGKGFQIKAKMLNMSQFILFHNTNLEVFTSLCDFDFFFINIKNPYIIQE